MPSRTLPDDPTPPDASPEEVAALRARIFELETELASLKASHTLPIENALLEAIDALTDGFAIFDERQRLVYCNSSYRAMYAPLSDNWTLGGRIEETAREAAVHFLELGEADVETFLRGRLAAHRAGDGSWQEQVTRDGRYLRVVEHRLRNGWIAGIRTDVTALRRSEEASRALVECLDAGAVGYALFDREDRLVSCNRTWREEHNAAISDLLVSGARFEDLTTASVEAGAVKEAATHKQEWLAKRLERHAFPGPPFAVQFAENVWHQVMETRMPDGGTLLIQIDISGQKHIERSLRRTEGVLRDAAASMSEGFSYWDENDRLVLCNERYREMFAPIADALIPGADFGELGRLMVQRGGLIPSENTQEWMNQRIDRRRQNEPVDFHFADGRWIRCIDARTRAGERLCFRLDVTEQKLTEARLHEAMRDAEQANSAKSEFLARMSHELRTPLNAILGFAQLLEVTAQTELSVKQQEFVRQILRGGRHLVELIDEVLDLVKIESGRLQLLVESVDIRILLDECSELLEPLRSAKGITLTVNAPPDLPPVRGDSLRLKQVLFNLMSNAVNYNRADGEVRVRLQTTKRGELTVTVADTGRGIAPDSLDRIFEPFDRLGESEHQSKGTGIGLSITRRLVEAMHGTLRVRSTLGVGSEFEVVLPVDDPSLAAQPLGDGPNSGIVPPAAQG